MHFRALAFSLIVLPVVFVSTPVRSDAAIVSFTGSLLTGDPGNLGTLPRPFVLTLDYSENLVGNTAGATGSFEFSATTTPAQAARSVPTTGTITIVDAPGPGGNDSFSFSGSIPAKQLSNSNQAVLYNFSFLQSADTIDNSFVSAENISKLIIGSATTSLVNNQVNTQGILFGNLQSVPEPNAASALIGLVGICCGFEYRRRRKRRRAKPNHADRS